jgi:predicted ATPase
MDQTLEPPEVRYENDIDSFSIHQVSSMVSEIAPIVLYLKHLVQEGHLFIIEEPESHLDAANQMKLARAIAMLVNAGVYVLITTHSDFFVKQLDNLLLVSQLTPRRRAARKYSATEVLQPSDVGAYMFEPGPDGSTVRTLEVTADGGIPTEPFSDAHSDLYDEAIALEHIAR